MLYEFLNGHFEVSRHNIDDFIFIRVDASCYFSLFGDSL